MQKLFFVLCFLAPFWLKANTPSLSSQTTVSVITCDEGSEIYSLFGHSAIRIKDPVTHKDLVYNWGMFEFGDDVIDFQYRFAKGKLKYYMAEERYENFIYTYQFEQRTVREQVLNLTYEDVLNLWELIQINYKPENRYYQYDFFFDNCSTRIADILEKALKNKLKIAELPEANQYTYRQLIDKQVSTSQPWSDFGIDLALGAKIDKVTTSKEMMFLPKYLEQALALSFVRQQNKKQPFVKQTRVLVEGKDLDIIPYDGISPLKLSWYIFIFALVIHIFYIPYLTPFFDGLFFTTIGIMGVVLVFLWFGTDHQATKINYNLLWANPIHLVAVFVLLFKNKIKNTSTFFVVLAYYSFAIILFWIAIPQEYNDAFKPLILTLVLCYYYLYRRTRIVETG